MFINHIPAADLAMIVAGLVRQGVTFKATPENDGATSYVIELTGGY